MDRIARIAAVSLALVMLLPHVGLTQSPSPAAGQSGRAVDECVPATEECLREALDRARDRVTEFDPELRVQPPEPYQGGQRTDTLVNYLVDTVFLVNGYWAAQFEEAGLAYEHISYAVLGPGDSEQESNCHAQGDRSNKAVARPGRGPFYCAIGGQAFDTSYQGPIVYLGAPWLAEEALKVDPGNHDFALVTVVAHEFGHHIQRQLLGAQLVQELTGTWMELGADCLAGVFAHAAYFGEAGQLTDTDVEEGMEVLWNLGNDLPFDQGGGPHGTRQQRETAFLMGYDTGSADVCLAEEWPEGS